MKTWRTLLLAMAVLGIAAFAGCAPRETPLASMPKFLEGQPSRMVELSAADFEENPHITREVELVRPGSLIVTLESGPAPDLVWNPTTEISCPVVTQVSYALTTPVEAPGVAAAAASAKDVWVFDTAAAGEGLVRFVYGEPGAAKGPRWTLTVYLTVK